MAYCSMPRSHKEAGLAMQIRRQNVHDEMKETQWQAGGEAVNYLEELFAKARPSHGRFCPSSEKSAEGG